MLFTPRVPRPESVVDLIHVPVRSQMSRILVTGALGNVGREVVRECEARGLEVRAALRDPNEDAKHFSGTETVAFDFLDRRTWERAVSGCSALFLLRPPPIGDMETTLCPFVDVAYAAGVKHVVFLSVAGADRMKWVPHRKVELHLEKTGKLWTLLRPGFFAQNLQDAYRKDIVEDNRIYVPAGEGRVAFVDVRDIAAVAGHVLASPETFRSQALTLTGPEAIPFTAVTETLTAVLGRTIRYDAATIPGYAWHLRTKRNMAWMQIAVQTILHVGLRGGDAETVDPTVERLLGRPARRLADYVRESAATWSSRA